MGKGGSKKESRSLPVNEFYVDTCEIDMFEVHGMFYEPHHVSSRWHD